jgi:serine protease Do
MNINGEVIGINTAIRGGAQGLGFATPINTAKRLLPQLREGKVVRSFLGMNIQEVNEQSRQAFGLNETRGALVQNVTPGKPADKAGLEPGDVIVEIDSKKINNNRELIDYISYLPVGTKVNLAIIRNGQRRNLTATTAERDVEQERAEAPASEAVAPTRNKLGLSVQDLTAATRQMYSVDDRVSGVVVTDVKEVSPAGEVGISEGDVISEVQGQKITSVSQFRDAVDRLRSGTTIRMYVTTSTRGGQSVSAYRFLQVP